MNQSARLCITTAGVGSRMGRFATIINKALLPIDRKAAISHIIEKFPRDVGVTVICGYQAGQVRAYLDLAHPDRQINCIDVDRYEGEGTGPGYSLLAAREELQCPFYYISCDTLWEGTLPEDRETNWAATATITGDSSAYCNFEIDPASGLVRAIKDKEDVPATNHESFSGLCFVRDYETFWQALASGDTIKNEVQISNGLRALVASGSLKTKLIDWWDIGDEEKYDEVRARFEAYDFSKTNEFVYLQSDRVIKFFANAAIAARRADRARANPAAFPEILGSADQFYGYAKIPGRVFYECYDETVYRDFLKFLEGALWRPVDVDSEKMRAACTKFYHDKTLGRIKLYDEKYPGNRGPDKANGRALKPLEELLDAVPWDDLASGVPVFFHGDLQFDNVILGSGDRRFVLLDWREDFGGNVEFGDLYYDLAKMYGGLILNYDLIKLDLMDYQEEGDECRYDFARHDAAVRFVPVLEKYIREKGHDLRRVRILVGLIYLNMSPLHHHPFDRLLYALGRTMLQEALEL